MSDALTKSERETLKSIYRLSRDGEEAHTGALAEALGVSPGTATATVKRLAERGLLDHRPYRGVELTVTGRRAAVAAIRRHRIVERFLSDMLGYAWNEADRLAGSCSGSRVTTARSARRSRNRCTSAKSRRHSRRRHRHRRSRPREGSSPHDEARRGRRGLPGLQARWHRVVLAGVLGGHRRPR